MKPKAIRNVATMQGFAAPRACFGYKDPIACLESLNSCLASFDLPFPEFDFHEAMLLFLGCTAGTGPVRSILMWRHHVTTE